VEARGPNLKANVFRAATSNMPFETVDEQYVRERKVLVCERCRRQMAGVVQNRGAYQTGGSITGSLGGSMGGSMLAGAVLGPVGAIAGMIGGAVAGSRAGAAASEGICDAVDSSATHLCEACKAAPPPRPAGTQNWGGGRLGSDSEPSAVPAPQAAASQPSVGDKISETASAAGETLSSAASVVGENLSGMGSWLRKSVSSVTGGSSSEKPESASGAGKKEQAFKAFEGSGRTLGSTDGPPPRSAAAEAAMRRASQAGTSGGYSQGAPGTQATPASHVADDEALARQLQEQFLMEDRQQR